MIMQFMIMIIMIMIVIMMVMMVMIMIMMKIIMKKLFLLLPILFLASCTGSGMSSGLLLQEINTKETKVVKKVEKKEDEK